jgi:predicted nucleic acid-binding protein
MYLFDSNAIAITIKRLREKAVEALYGKATLNLAHYELGNMLWKECVLKGLISQEEALQKAEDMARMLEALRIEGIESSEDFKGVMKLATDLKLTFYDASYMYLAKNKDFTLVTEDKELSKKAEETNIKTITVNEFLKIACK